MAVVVGREDDRPVEVAQCGRGRDARGRPMTRTAGPDHGLEQHAAGRSGLPACGPTRCRSRRRSCGFGGGGSTARRGRRRGAGTRSRLTTLASGRPGTVPHERRGRASLRRAAPTPPPANRGVSAPRVDVGHDQGRVVEVGDGGLRGRRRRWPSRRRRRMVDAGRKPRRRTARAFAADDDHSAPRCCRAWAPQYHM